MLSRPCWCALFCRMHSLALSLVGLSGGLRLLCSDSRSSTRYRRAATTLPIPVSRGSRREVCALVELGRCSGLTLISRPFCSKANLNSTGLGGKRVGSRHHAHESNCSIRIIVAQASDNCAAKKRPDLIEASQQLQCSAAWVHEISPGLLTLYRKIMSHHESHIFASRSLHVLRVCTRTAAVSYCSNLRLVRRFAPRHRVADRSHLLRASNTSAAAAAAAAASCQQCSR